MNCIRSEQQSIKHNQNSTSILIQKQLSNHYKLIINADDFGYSEPRDQGIIQLIKLDKIKSISVLINGKNIHNSSIILKQLIQSKQRKDTQREEQKQKQFNSINLNNLSIGLHFNLTEGIPISIKKPISKHKASQQQSKSNQLIDFSTNQFLGKQRLYNYFKKFTQKNQSLSIDMKQFIKQQFRAQIRQFIKIFKFRPSHIDGHNHVHVIPQICRLVAPLMKQYGIYKTRQPLQSINSYQQQFNSSYNKIFIQNALNSKKIFDQQSIVYPNHFIGLKSINKLNPNDIIRQIQSFKNLQKQNNCIELMCHPGYLNKQSVDQFDNSVSRQVQLSSLKSQQFHNTIFNHKLLRIKLSNFNQLSPYFSNNIEKRILLYSKMNNGSGNWTTSLRLQKIFKKLGYTVYMRSIQQQILSQYQINSLKSFLTYFRITLVVGVNLTRSAKIIYKVTRSCQYITYRIPVIFIVAGTDANIYFKKPQAIQNLLLPIKQCSLLISLSQNMLQLTRQFLHEKLHIFNKQIVYLSQSSNILSFQTNKQSILNIHKSIQQKYSLRIKQQKYILFPTSFRPVKDVAFLLQTLNKLIHFNYSLKLRVFILGPILQQKYYHHCQDKLGKIQYLGCLSKQIYVEFLKNALFIINTSISEGQSCSIQQALEVQQLVVVRNNQGNSQLIQHRQNGFLFSTPQQFQQLFYYIIHGHQDEINRIKKNGKQYHQNFFSIQAQIQRYGNIFDKVLTTKQKLFAYDDIHPVSDVNVQLFNKVPVQVLTNWYMNSKNKRKRVIDLGCGSGIFGKKIIKKFPQDIQSHINLQFYDFKSQILSNFYYNALQLRSNQFKQINSIFLKVSDMFQQIQQPQEQNLYLANMPQTPFQIQSTRPDRNGGVDSFKFNQILLQAFSKFRQNSVLIMLYSYMSNPIKFFSLVQSLKLQIVFRSGKIDHIILQQNYQKMEEGLSQYIKKHIQVTKSQVIIDKNNNSSIFKVPAQILVFRIKNN